MEIRLKNLIFFIIIFTFFFFLFNFSFLNKIDSYIKQDIITENKSTNTNNVEIWSKAAIGDYLWFHIIKGEINQNFQNGYYRFGKKKINKILFKFRNGFHLQPDLLESFLLKKLNETSKFNLILVLNGRIEKNVDYSKLFLDKIFNYRNNLNLGVILLGNENCFNDWIKKYLRVNNGSIDFLFIVYDWAEIDNENIFQWPLGVATYRNFSFVEADKNLIKDERNYLCNYFATVYNKTSREELKNLIESDNFLKKNCLTKIRLNWLDNETEESLKSYQDALRYSDYTLSPIGMNHESYRIYEAFSFLSMPILEENLNHVKGKKSKCDQNSSYRLLKQFKAPVHIISNWTQNLNHILHNNMTYEEKLLQRINILNWYEQFKNKLLKKFIKVVAKKFKFGK